MTYVENVEHNLNGLTAVSTGVCPGCEECRSTYAPDMSMEEFDNAYSSGSVYGEASFSWGSCGICGSTLGGDREVWHGLDDLTGTLYHFDDACVDCVMYLANGDIPEGQG